MYKNLLHTLAIIILFTSCQTKQRRSDNNVKDSAEVIKAVDTNSLSTLDTTIFLSSISNSKYNGIDLNDSIAKNVLYNYFRKKGLLTSDKLPNIAKLTKKDKANLSVEFTSIFKMNLNNNKYTDAVITYWLTPPYANGHCWQPHKAIITDTDTGYQITNEEFIPDNYAVDSISTVKEQITILGYDYDCANNKTLKNLKVRLAK